MAMEFGVLGGPDNKDCGFCFGVYIRVPYFGKLPHSSRLHDPRP